MRGVQPKKKKKNKCKKKVTNACSNASLEVHKRKP
jgi:hypothetical protein